MSDKEDSKKNTHVNNVSKTFPKEEGGSERRLSRDEYIQVSGLALQIQDTIGQPENYRSYFARAAEAVRRGHRGVQALMEVLSVTKDATHRAQVKKTPSQYFHDQWKRVLTTLGPELPPPKRSSESDSQERMSARVAVAEFLSRPRMRPAADSDHPYGDHHED